MLYVISITIYCKYVMCVTNVLKEPNSYSFNLVGLLHLYKRININVFKTI